MVQIIENRENRQNKPSITEGSPSLDTLAQLGTVSLRKKAKSKWFTQKLTKELGLLSSPLFSQYQRAFFCNQTLTQHDRNKITSKYCNSRACNLCNRIRTAKMMNGYILPLKELGNMQFVTLTEPNVKECDLEETIKNQTKKVSNIIEVLRKRRKIAVSGIRKLECTYNINSNTYHPHVHILINKDCGNLFIEEWLKRTPKAKSVAQKCQEADQNSLNELFKYTTKQYEIETENKTLEINVRSLDVILRAFDKKRTFQSFGEIRKVKVSEEVEELQVQEYSDLPNYQRMEWEWSICDWFNIYNEALSNHKEPNITINATNKTYMKWTEKEQTRALKKTKKDQDKEAILNYQRMRVKHKVV